VTLEGSIAPLGTGYRASFRILDKDGAVVGSRQVEGHEASCRSLDDRAVLVASILVDDAAREKKRVSPPPPPPLPPPPPGPVRAPLAPPFREGPVTPPPSSEAAWRFWLDVGVGVTTGLQPGVGVGLAVTALLRPPAFVPFYLGAGLYPSTQASVARGGTIDADVKLGAVGLCPLVLGAGRLELLGCGGLLLGGLDARASGFDESFGDLAVLVGGTLSARGSLRVAGPLAIYAGLGGHFALVRAELGYREADQARTAFTSAPLGLFSDVGLGLRLP